jgi:hypothetical protein
VVVQLNELLDKSLFLCGKGGVGGEVVDKISYMIHEAYQKQLEPGFKEQRS